MYRNTDLFEVADVGGGDCGIGHRELYCNPNKGSSVDFDLTQ